jgi:hypothetical protein
MKAVHLLQRIAMYGNQSLGSIKLRKILTCSETAQFERKIARCGLVTWELTESEQVEGTIVVHIKVRTKWTKHW